MKTCPYCFETINSEQTVCPLCGEELDPPPFTRLDNPRNVTDLLPDDLAEFYRRFEGCGLELDLAAALRDLRLAKLDELKLLGPKDIHAESMTEWALFRGIRIAAGSYGDEICYVLHAPVAACGSILAFGSDVAGPGGVGQAQLEGSLVLANDLTSWLTRLGEDGWHEYGLHPGTISDLPASRARILTQLFRSLNPAIKWGSR